MFQTMNILFLNDNLYYYHYFCTPTILDPLWGLSNPGPDIYTGDWVTNNNVVEREWPIA